MSVIVKDADGKYILYTKGAESTMIPRCNPSKFSSPHLQFNLFYNSRFLADTTKIINKYASQGYRTLLLAKRELDETEYLAWKKRYQGSTK
jgi:phospholipid-translocating ATPase